MTESTINKTEPMTNKQNIEYENIIERLLSHIRCEDENIISNINECKNTEDKFKYINKCLHSGTKFRYDDGNNKYGINSVEELKELFQDEKTITRNIVEYNLSKDSNKMLNVVYKLIIDAIEQGKGLEYNKKSFKSKEDFKQFFKKNQCNFNEIFAADIIEQNKDLLSGVYNNTFGNAKLQAQQCMNYMKNKIENEEYNKIVEEFFLHLATLLQQQEQQNKLPKQLNELQKQSNELIKQLNELQKQWDELLKQRDELQKQQEPINLQRNELLKQQNELQWDELKQKLDELQGQWDELQKQQEPINSQLNELIKQQEPINSQLNELLKQQNELIKQQLCNESEQKLNQNNQSQEYTLKSKEINADDKISKIIQEGYSIRYLMTEFEKYCRENHYDEEIIKKFKDKVIYEQDKKEMEKFFKEKESFKSKLNNVKIGFKNSEIMNEKQKEINEILSNSFSHMIEIDNLIQGTDCLLKSIDDLVTNLNSLNDLKRRNDCEYVIKNSKELFNQIREKIGNISKHSMNTENKLCNSVFDIIIDKYMEIYNNNKMHKEKLTFDNVYETKKHKDNFKEVAEIFLGNDDNALEKYCKERNKKKLKEDIKKLKTNEYVVEKTTNNEGKSCFKINKKNDKEYIITKQDGKSLIYCIENEIKKNRKIFTERRNLESLLKDIKSILKYQQIEGMTR